MVSSIPHGPLRRGQFPVVGVPAAPVALASDIGNWQLTRPRSGISVLLCVSGVRLSLFGCLFAN
jgi:hypothetical protein